MTLTRANLAAAFVSLVSSSPAWASTEADIADSAATTTTSHFHADMEVDPTAYVLDGYSLHAGLGWRNLRLDLGVFAMAVPGAVHGQDGFDASFDGYGVKLQWFPLRQQSGLFVGVDGGLVRALVKRQGTQLAARDRQASLGVNAGYRLDIAGGLYATAWLGLGYVLGADDAVLGDRTYDANPWTVFPAIHIGYHLR
jgi:hypothetical protein